MPRSSSVLDGGRFGDEAFRLQNLLQCIPFSRITQPNADPNYRIQTGQSQLLQVAEALSRLIRDADRSMNSNSPRTGDEPQIWPVGVGTSMLHAGDTTRVQCPRSGESRMDSFRAARPGRNGKGLAISDRFRFNAHRVQHTQNDTASRPPESD